MIVANRQIANEPDVPKSTVRNVCGQTMDHKKKENSRQVVGIAVDRTEPHVHGPAPISSASLISVTICIRRISRQSV